jgi:hypothetical protein
MRFVVDLLSISIYNIGIFWQYWHQITFYVMENISHTCDVLVANANDEFPSRLKQ